MAAAVSCRRGFLEVAKASFPHDASADDADYEAGHRLELPVLALWGESGLLGKLPTLEIWKDYANDVTGTAIAECGHFLAEERPRALLEHLKPFLAG